MPLLFVEGLRLFDHIDIEIGKDQGYRVTRTDIRFHVVKVRLRGKHMKIKLNSLA